MENFHFDSMQINHYSLLLTWRALKPITHVPHCQSALWSSMFRHLANPVLADGEGFHQLGLIVEPADWGVSQYGCGDTIQLGIWVPVNETLRFARMLSQLNQPGQTHGQFEPGNTLLLEAITCRVTGTSWPGPEARPLTDNDLFHAARRWQTKGGVDCWFRAPLRLTKPPQQKGTGRYADEAYFRENPLSPAHLAQTIGLDRLELDPPGCAGSWLDVPYGRTTKPTNLGGFVGRLRFKGEASFQDRLALIHASLAGIGKNRAFGFGLFHFDGRDQVLDLLPLSDRRGERKKGREKEVDAMRNPSSRVLKSLKPQDFAQCTLICLDIEEPNLQQQIHRCLAREAIRLQPTVYLHGGPKPQLDHLRQKLTALVGDQQAIMVLPLCAHCLNQGSFLGRTQDLMEVKA